MSNQSSPLSVQLAGINLRNPVILAAGTHGTLDEFADVCDLSRVGGLVTKSITPKPREGNATYRILDLPGGAGMLNAVGLANPGIDAFEEHDLPRAGAIPCAVIASAAGFSVEDYVSLAATFDEWGRGPRGAGDGQRAGSASVPAPTPCLDAIELNVSCPNVKAGCEFVSSPPLLKEVVAECRKVVTRAQLIVKLSPLVTDIVAIARAAIDAGADALTISNTIPAMSIDVHTRAPRLSNVTGGMSGPGLHPVALRLVHLVYTNAARDARVPIIGTGGVMTWEDAAEFILAGASAVQMGTALLADPRSPLRVVRGLERWAARQGASGIGELVGALRTG